jgi:hypothetical protein
MVLASVPDANDEEIRRLVVAGPPVTAFENTEILRGEQGGLLGVVDASNGQSLSQTAIEAPPVFDGMCAARGRIVLTLTSEAVVAFE